MFAPKMFGEGPVGVLRAGAADCHEQFSLSSAAKLRFRDLLPA
jgi:hypothetical protein